jgi:hypothetical protein
LKEHEMTFPHAGTPKFMDHHRAHKRVRVNMRVSYIDNNYTRSMGKVWNLSRGGMFINTGSRPDIDGLVIASMNVEEFGKVIWVRGRVVRKTDSGMAIIFTRTDSKGLDNLLSYWNAPF